MKDNIRKILRENIDTNSLGIKVTKPTQELIIMRGIPGAGKSTKAKELVGDGQIFSTDDRIEAEGDYREFFKNMIDSKDFGPLGRMHNLNFKMAKQAMESGVSPVVVDNTNIKANEPKNYVEAALQMGYADDNIKFVEVGTGGLSAEELADRNTHGVPLDKIKSMIQAYKSVGPLTLDKVIKAKSMYGNKPKLLASLILDDASHKKLVEATKQYIPEGWKIFAHHMTINFGKGLPEDLKGDLDTKKFIRATEIGVSDMAIAVKVEGYHSDNDIPHVTVAVNTSEGGKPVMSNKITNWEKLENYINLSGIVSEQKLG
jgi:predicted kinase